MLIARTPEPRTLSGKLVAGDHIRDRITHRAGVVTHVYADGWLRVRWGAGGETPAEPRDLEPDPYYCR
jgi:hypothetical protein